MQLSNDERRALAVILGLLLLATAARWVERPRPLLPDVPAVDVAALEDASRAAKPLPRAEKGGAPVPLNTGTARDLERLPGVGPAVAARIVEAREQGGPFRSVTDLQARVRGVGPAMVAKWDGLVDLPHEAPASGTLSPGAGVSPGAGLSPGVGVSAGAGASPGAGVSPGAVAGAVAGPAATASVRAIDLNRATAGDLEKISGVGPILAGRLVARRDSLGGFRDWADVDAVPGVGPAMLARLKGLAVLGQ